MHYQRPHLLRYVAIAKLASAGHRGVFVADLAHLLTHPAQPPSLITNQTDTPDTDRINRLTVLLIDNAYALAYRYVKTAVKPQNPHYQQPWVASDTNARLKCI